MIDIVKSTSYGDGTSTVEIKKDEYDRIQKIVDAAEACAKRGALRVIGSSWTGCLYEKDFKALCDSVGMQPNIPHSDYD